MQSDFPIPYTQGGVNAFVAGTDACGNPGGAVSGIFTFKGMISTGFLDASGAPAQGIDYRFDNCSQTVRVSGLVIPSSEYSIPSRLFTSQAHKL